MLEANKAALKGGVSNPNFSMKTKVEQLRQELTYLLPGPIEIWEPEDLRRYDALRKSGMYHLHPVLRLGPLAYRPEHVLDAPCRRVSEVVVFRPSREIEGRARKEIDELYTTRLWKEVSFAEFIAFARAHEDLNRVCFSDILKALVFFLGKGLPAKTAEEVLRKLLARAEEIYTYRPNDHTFEQVVFLLACLDASSTAIVEILKLHLNLSEVEAAYLNEELESQTQKDEK